MAHEQIQTGGFKIPWEADLGKMSKKSFGGDDNKKELRNIHLHVWCSVNTPFLEGIVQWGPLFSGPSHGDANKDNCSVPK